MTEVKFSRCGLSYLNKKELESLGRIVNAFLDLAENRAERNIPMTMQDWAKRIKMQFVLHFSKKRSGGYRIFIVI
jgi:hypothetical protein